MRTRSRKSRPHELFSHIALALLIALSLTACATAGNARGFISDGRVRVTATFSVLADLVRNVGGDRIQVRILVGPGADAHTFEPSPADSVSILEADVLFENGLGFEPWLDDMYASSGSTADRVAVTEGLKGLIEPGEEHEEAAGHEDGEEHGGEYDPHVWHDVTLTMEIVGAIREALTSADPENSAFYNDNAGRYIGELQELDRFVRKRAESLPEARRELVTTHDTFGYFARRYGFEVVDTALGISTEQNEPSAAELTRLLKEVREAGAPVLFADNISNAGIMEQVAVETGVRLGPPLYTDALGEPGSEGDTYIKMLRYNVLTITEALGQ